MAAAAALLFGQLVTDTATAAQSITVAPNDPNAENTFPFGQGTGWIPYMGFVYQNVPAFQLKPNDVLAFDLNTVNEVDIQLDIAMAPTVSNGSDVPAAGFTPIVPNTQAPGSRGDAVDGDYELEFKAVAPFNFPGGGLIIRFSNPGSQLATDPDGAGSFHNGGTNTDTSGFFVERFVRDPDGVYPWTGDTYNTDIAAFRLQILDLPATPPASPTPTAKKKKCKKKHKKRSASVAKKKKCKKKRR
jgi:hypothetical protein